MANKEVKYTFQGVNQDTTKSKHSFKYYYEAEHIRLLSTDSQSTGSMINEKGNEIVITIPNVSIDVINRKVTWEALDFNTSIGYVSTEIDEQITAGLLPTTSTTQKIIGTSDTRDSIVIFTTDDLGMDCIWQVNNILKNDYSLRLLYVRNLNFSINNPIQALFNYENDIIQKIYWVDGFNQLRFLNTKHSILNGDLENLIDINSNTINFVGTFGLNQPIIDSITSGGSHTSGVIQYAYNLYRLNSSQTTISPLTDIVALDKGVSLGGGEVNEVVGTTPIIKVTNIDPEYTHIRLYGIKYTSYNQEPQVFLLSDREVGSESVVTYFDDGSYISTLTLEEFLFLGSDPIIPRHIESKDNILFSAAITEKNFDVDLDCRAYSFLKDSSTAYVLNNVELIGGTLGIPQATPQVGGSFVQIPIDYDIDLKHDSINPNYNKYRYQRGTSIEGGVGKYIKYNITPTLKTNFTEEQAADNKFFKSKEIYRVGIQFYNRLGQKSFPKWIADFKAPEGNLGDHFNTLRVELTSDFYVWLNNSSNFEEENDKPIGYKIIRADRTLQDRSILYQGILSSMMFQVKGEEAKNFEQFPTNTPDFQDNKSLKFPSYFVRNFSDTMSLYPELGSPNVIPTSIFKSEHLAWVSDVGANGKREVLSVVDSDSKISQTFQFTKMMQLHSPDILFDFATVRNGLQVRVNGLAKRTGEFVESQETYTATGLEKSGGKFRFFETGEVRGYLENNSMRSTFITPENGTRFIGPSGDSETTDFYQYYREFNEFVYPDAESDLDYYPIYGTPEVSENGGSKKDYNGDARYKYSNTLESFTSDGEDDCSDDNCDAIVSLNSWGVKCLTLMLGDALTNTSNRPGLEDLFNASDITDDEGVLSVDITIPNENIYLGNIYGGNTFEAKKRNTYLEIGNYYDISNSNVLILSPGDTFVGNYKILRVGKTDTSILDTRIPQFSEVISFPVETTVDIKNRNDLSLYGWDNRFQPRFDEFHAYNRVYSQQPTLVSNTAEGFTFKKIDSFDTRILASKVKIPGEAIDGWTDLLINETQDLDGKYGPINGLINFKDELFTWQDEAIASLVINPRLQVQSTSGLDIELGTGNTFYDYKYITTQAGSINKWGILPTKKGIYYYDALNKNIGRVPDYTTVSLSDAKGLHTFFNNNYNYDNIKEDNPLLKKGPILGYDNYNNDVYITLHQDTEDTKSKDRKSFTRVYNELVDEFIDRKTYLPSGYIYKGEKLLLTDSFNENIYEQFAGEYNKYFGVKTPSTITLMINPEADYECVFNNIQYKSEVYISDLDHPDKTLTHIQAYNEYQDTGKIQLVIGRDKNLRRKFREWKADIPRQGRERIRNTWIYLKLSYDDTSGGKLILHDIIVSYTVQ